MIFLALKTEDGRMTGKISFYCRMLGVSRQGFYSDRGTQYTSEAYRQTIRKYHIHQSMNSAGGRCHDNARCETCGPE